jgi:hypothetical protein
MAELGSGNGTDYPSALDTDNTLEVDNTTLARADVPNDMGAAIVAIENELGTNPSGTTANVKTFVQVEHSTNGTHDATKVVMIAGAQTITGEKLFSETIRFTKGSDVASATTLTLGAGNYFDITGTTTITGITSIGTGVWVRLHFDGALQLTHHATDFVLIGGASFNTAAGDEAFFIEYETGKWRMVAFSTPVPNTVDTASIQADAVTSAKVGQANTEGSQLIQAGNTYTPAAGTHIVGWYRAGAGAVTFQANLNGDWRTLETDAGVGTKCDGTNHRFDNSSGSDGTIYFRTLD